MGISTSSAASASSRNNKQEDIQDRQVDGQGGDRRRGGLVGQFRELYPDTFAYDGKRAITFGPDDRPPLGALKHCLALALTHHLRAK